MEIIYGKQNIDRTVIKPMTAQQATQKKYYDKIWKDDNGLIKKIETYSHQNLIAIDYYLDAGEDETLLLASFSELVSYIRFFERKINMGNFFLEREREYNLDQRTLDVYSHKLRVYDNQDRLICYAPTDENYNPFGDLVKKYLYTDFTIVDIDGTVNSDPYYLDFNYIDGEILSIGVNNGHTVYEEEYYVDDLYDIGELMERFGGTLSNYQYYLNPHWMPS